MKFNNSIMLSGFLSRRKEREDEDIGLNNNSKPVTMSIADAMEINNNSDFKKLICSLRHICGPRKGDGRCGGRRRKTWLLFESRKEESRLQWRKQGLPVPRPWEDPVRGEGQVLFPEAVLSIAYLYLNLQVLWFWLDLQGWQQGRVMHKARWATECKSLVRW